MSVREIAAEWVVRINDPEATEADFSEWQAWLAQDSVHRQTYMALEHAWHRAAQVTVPRDIRMTETPSEMHFRPFGALPVGIAATLLLVSLAGLSAWYFQRSHIIETATAEQRSVRLDDGSRVELAGESRLAVDLQEDRRTLRLEQGEAYFDVAPDQNRPFTVDVDGHQVRAIGTSFNIEKSVDRAVVTVTKGVVQIAGKSAPLTLQAGEQAFAGKQGVRKVVAAKNLQAATAWRDGRLEYLHEELRYVLEDVNRYVHRKIVMTDPQLAHQEFTGTVFLDHLEEWLETLSGSFPVTVVERGSTRELVRSEK